MGHLRLLAWCPKAPQSLHFTCGGRRTWSPRQEKSQAAFKVGFVSTHFERRLLAWDRGLDLWQWVSGRGRGCGASQSLCSREGHGREDWRSQGEDEEPDGKTETNTQLDVTANRKRACSSESLNGPVGLVWRTQDSGALPVEGQQTYGDTMVPVRPCPWSPGHARFPTDPSLHLPWDPPPLPGKHSAPLLPWVASSVSGP